MYGPYDQNGNMWNKDEIDVCNGMLVNGRYSYVSTTWHPYMLGCYGPGNIPQYDHACSYNTRNADCVPLFSDETYFTSVGSMQGGGNMQGGSNM